MYKNFGWVQSKNCVNLQINLGRIGLITILNLHISLVFFLKHSSLSFCTHFTGVRIPNYWIFFGTMVMANGIHFWFLSPLWNTGIQLMLVLDPVTLKFGSRCICVDTDAGGFYVSLTQAEVIWEERTSIEKNAFVRLDCRQACRSSS